MLSVLVFVAAFVLSPLSFAHPLSHHALSCADIRLPHIPGAKVIDVQYDEKRNHTVPETLPFLPETVSGLNICEVIVTLSHPGANDKVSVQVWLPIGTWNGRFVGTGGQGWAAGLGDLALAPFAAEGFAVASTDAGLPYNPESPQAWALDTSGHVNIGLLTNFASRSVHDLAVVGKAVTASYYKNAANHSYWYGCSTGGRQGLVEAQKYPDDFDGILAGAPAIYWPEYVVAELWPQAVMNEAQVYPSQCELKWFTQTAIDACDELDGVKDGIINDPSKCKYNPSTAVGSKIKCDGKTTTVSTEVAEIVRKIWEGPGSLYGLPRWSGLTLGAPLDSLANTTVSHGTHVGNTFFVPEGWIRYFVEADPDFDFSKVGYKDFDYIFQRSVAKYESLIGSDNPNLSGFQKSNGKLLMWHGLSDQLIFPQDSARYYQEVDKYGGRSSNVDDYLRLFLAPGVDHCGAGTTPGAIPSDPFGALISWVENGTAPEALSAVTPATAREQFTRKICRYPLVEKYRGHGKVDSAESFDCVEECEA
ncbi:tannase and feruloyl esterase [Rhizodiscina lignyota]|uniref:Carboxylic ester hydrolase n=1 Tax=Rhizodiscina lignyota TaxID=1504668 RepID=A0A9P4MB57_9PEZI|nr:tannase and feruloyl esterase [Rhizodiscina lignyota]